MTLVELIKKLQELNNDSRNANKRIVINIEENASRFWAYVSKVSEVDDHIELE